MEAAYPVAFAPETIKPMSQKQPLVVALIIAKWHTFEKHDVFGLTAQGQYISVGGCLEFEEACDLAAAKAHEFGVTAYLDGEPYIEGRPRHIEPSRSLEDVLAERLRQDAKWGEQNHDDLYWLGIQTEEVGEVAKECIEAALNDGIDHEENLRIELTHVAAVALQWIEAIDRRRAKRPVGKVEQALIESHNEIKVAFADGYEARKAFGSTNWAALIRRLQLSGARWADATLDASRVSTLRIMWDGHLAVEQASKILGFPLIPNEVS